MRATQVLIAAARQLRPSSRCVFCGVRGLYIAGAHIFLWAGFSSDNNVEKKAACDAASKLLLGDTPGCWLA